MPTAISQKILGLITPNMDMTQPGRVLKKQIQSAAVEFQKPWTLAQLDQERMDANARLHSFEKKEPVDQYAATRGNNRTGCRLTAPLPECGASGIRSYPMMDNLFGEASRLTLPNSRTGLERLMNLDSDARENRDKLRTKSLAAEGAPFMERHGAHGIVNSEGRPHFYFSNFLTSSDPLTTAGKTAAGAFAGPVTSAAQETAALVEALR